MSIDFQAAKQRSPEWFKARLGKVTASRIADVMAKLKNGKPSEARTRYMKELLCERITGQATSVFVTEAMQRGIDLEDVARERYEFETNEVVKQVGMFSHLTILQSGASPDGLVGDEGLIEIKCPTSGKHIDNILNGVCEYKYILQMQWQMACTGRKWCDFVSFDDRLPNKLSYFSFRLERDDEKIAEIENEVRLFLDELELMVQKLYESAN